MRWLACVVGRISVRRVSSARKLTLHCLCIESGLLGGLFIRAVNFVSAQQANFRACILARPDAPVASSVLLLQNSAAHKSNLIRTRRFC
jgi:hypothetical protein